MSALKGLNLPLNQPILGPVVALNVWTLAMEAWMYALRLPALQKVKIGPETTAQDFDRLLPKEVQWPAHNYNHLHQQPTQFYATAITLALLGVNDKTTVSLAWTYVGLRIVHSLIQSTVNIIPLRFFVFASSSVTLLGMTAKAVAQVFYQ